VRIRAGEDTLTLRAKFIELESQSYPDEQVLTVLLDAIRTRKTVRVMLSDTEEYEFHVDLKGR
jgi:hypothetical protein